MKPRVLHVITVYNGRAFVPRAIESALRIDQSVADIDVLILDDASPEPGWSEELGAFCRKAGAHYYRTPRNLGIPRNVSLGLATAIEKKFDYVTINNSDVIFPRNLVSGMIAALQDEKIGSVTAWANNVSIYSIPNADPDRFLSNQPTVDFISESFSRRYGAEALDVPAGISFCIMMPVEVVKRVGFMDPIFGRGYCEETDWSLRSLKMGYRVCLCPGVFVYHMGRGSNIAAGLVSGAHTTVPENEVIIDRRYPDFREQCNRFEATGLMPKYKSEAIEALLDDAAANFGYCIVPGWERDPDHVALPPVRVEVMPEGPSPTLRYVYAGFEQILQMTNPAAIAKAVARFGAKNLKYNAFPSITDDSARQSPYPLEVW
jgi:GT2 family glycosyltransferase